MWALAVIALVSAGALVVILRLGAHSSGAIAGASSSESQGFLEPDHTALELGLESSRPDAFVAALSPELRAAVHDPLALMLPAGATVRIDSATFHSIAGRFASVEMSVTGPTSGRWLLHLVFEDHHWLVLGMDPMR